MMTHIVALFGIPSFRIRTVNVVPDSAETGYGALGRRLAGGAHPLDGNASYAVNTTLMALLASAKTKTTELEINTAQYPPQGSNPRLTDWRNLLVTRAPLWTVL